MTIADVGSPIVLYNQGGSTVDTGNVDVTAGNVFLIGIAHYSPDATPFTASNITQSSGSGTIGTPVLDASGDLDLGLGVHQYAYVFRVPITGTGIVVLQFTSPSAGVYSFIAIQQKSHANTFSLEVGNKSGAGLSGTTPTTSDATSSGAALFFGAAAIDSPDAVTITPDAAFTQVAEEEDGTAHECGSCIQRLVASGTTDAASWSAPTNRNWTAALAVYNETGGGGATLSIDVSQGNSQYMRTGVRLTR